MLVSGCILHHELPENQPSEWLVTDAGVCSSRSARASIAGADSHVELEH